jgi:hypothetical protein
MRHTSPRREEEGQVEPEKTPRQRAEDLISLLVSGWRPTLQQRVWAIKIAFVLAVVVAIGYSYGITLWDWIKLLIVPAAIAAGSLWFNAQQRDREQKLANERAQDEALQAYLDHMSNMLIPTSKDLPSLYKARPGDSLSSVARARTLTALPRLDGPRKARVVQFVYESDLIAKGHPVLDLSGADLRQADLFAANLSNADLSNTDLTGAFILGANLSGVILARASMSGANLVAADLSNADLREAILSYANLRGAILNDADLRSALLGGADMSDADLSRATMPDGELYENWIKRQKEKANENE